MAIVDNAFREWIADFKATNPGVADSRAILDTAQYAFAAGRKAQRDIDAASQPVGNYEIQTENGPLKCSLAVYAEWQKNEEYIARLEEELKSARQPVGDLAEPIFQIKHHDDTEATWRDATKSAYEMQPSALRRMVYTTLPAQAVDLGMPIAMIDRALGHLSTALYDMDSSPDRRPGAMVTEAMACLRQALTGVPHG